MPNNGKSIAGRFNLHHREVIIIVFMPSKMIHQVHRSYLSTTALATFRPTNRIPAQRAPSMKVLCLAQKLVPSRDELTINIWNIIIVIKMAQTIQPRLFLFRAFFPILSQENEIIFIWTFNNFIMKGSYSPYNRTYKFLCLQNQLAHIKNKSSVKSLTKTNISFTSEKPHDQSLQNRSSILIEPTRQLHLQEYYKRKIQTEQNREN